MNNKLSILLCAILLITGCGGGEAEVIETVIFSGNVTFDGNPLEKGVIQFRPDKDDAGNLLRGKMTQAAITAGKYQLDSDKGAVVGNNIVLISAIKVVGKEMADGQEIDKIEQYLPAKYNTESTLTVKIQAGDTTHDFELTSQ